MRAPLPADEARRLATLYAHDLVDRPPSRRLDRLTRLACRYFDTPIALVTLVDADVQWTRSGRGIDLVAMPREGSFCAHAILSTELLIVEDTLTDVRFFDNPLVVGDPWVRFYGGYPVVADNGSRLGTLCVMDTRPRSLSQAERESFADLGELVREEIGSMVHGVVDELTGLVNRRGLRLIASQAISRSWRDGESISLLFIDLDEQHLDERYLDGGAVRRAPDEALVVVAATLRDCLRGVDVPARFRSDEFAVLLPGTSERQAHLVMERVSAALLASKHRCRALQSVGISIGCATLDPSDDFFGLDALIERADAAI